MKTLLTALLPAAMTLTSLTGCPCGGFEGRGDRVLRTTNGDAMQLCSNGGYSAMMANGTLLEGHFTDDTTLVTGSNGETGARAFTMTPEVDGSGSLTSAELGGGWTGVALDKVELDHAHVQCADLEARAWWPNSGSYLPADTAFVHVDGMVTEEILLCADGTARVPSREVASYSATDGMITIYARAELEGLYTAAGTLKLATVGEPDSLWTRVPVTSLSTSARCGGV